MITADEIREILSLYKKHGWILRRILLTENLKNSIADKSSTLFENTEISLSEINAAWFSRQSKGDSEAWEIRSLTRTPYALVEIFDAEDDEDDRAERRGEMEEQVKAKFKK